MKTATLKVPTKNLKQQLKELHERWAEEARNKITLEEPTQDLNEQLKELHGRWVKEARNKISRVNKPKMMRRKPNERSWNDRSLLDFFKVA